MSFRRTVNVNANVDANDVVCWNEGQLNFPASLLIFVGAVFTANPAFTQDTLRLTLDQALATALGQGTESEVVHQDSMAAAARWRSTRDLWLPQFSLISTPYSFDRYWYPGRAYSSERWSAELNLHQAMPWGGSVVVSQDASHYRSEYDDPALTGRSYYSGVRRIDLNQPLLSGNPGARARETARLDWHSSQLANDIRLRDIEFQVTSSFFGLVSAKASLNIAQQDLESGRNSAELAERKLAAGFIPEVELLQIQVDLSRRELAVKEMEGALESSLDDFRLKLGLPHEVTPEPIFDAWSDTTLPKAPPPPNLEDRPEVRQREMQLRKNELATRASIASARGDLTLSAGYGAYSGQSGSLDSALNGVDNEITHLTLSLDLPLFGFGTTSAEVQEAKASLRSAKASHRLTLDQTAAEQREAYRRLDRAADRIAIADKALGLSERSFKITEERFSNGLVSSRDLLDAQLDLTRNRNEAVRARIDYHLALANIKRFAPDKKLTPSLK